MSVKTEWLEEALCAQIGGDAWVLEKGESSAPAKKICGRCPVRDACLEAAYAMNEHFGVWGGLSARERFKIRKALGGVDSTAASA